MARRSTRTQAPLARSRAWLLRGVVLLALVLTLWIAGPGAWQALALRRAAQPDMSPRVTLDRVGFHDLPTWVGDDLLVGIGLGGTHLTAIGIMPKRLLSKDEGVWRYQQQMRI